MYFDAACPSVPCNIWPKRDLGYRFMCSYAFIAFEGQTWFRFAILGHKRPSKFGRRHVVEIQDHYTEQGNIQIRVQDMGPFIRPPQGYDNPWLSSIHPLVIESLVL